MLNNSRNDLCTDLYNNNIEEDNNNKNHLILSQNDIYNNPEYKHMNILDKFTLYPKQYIYNKFNGKKRTDITNKEIWDKIQPPTNQDYIDYIYKHKEVDLFNKRLIERKNKLIMSERNKLIMKEIKENPNSNEVNMVTYNNSVKSNTNHLPTFEESGRYV